MPLLLALAAMLGIAADPGAATPAAPRPPRLTWVFTIDVELGPPQEQGIVDGRRVRFVPITGGGVHGPRLNGTVLAGGGDWQAIHADGLTEINTRYSLRADDGTVIDIVNPGVRTAEPDVVARMTRGEPVDPSLYYFRTAPRMSVADGPHGWLRRTVFVGRGVRRPDSVAIEVFAVE